MTRPTHSYDILEDDEERDAADCHIVSYGGDSAGEALTDWAAENEYELREIYDRSGGWPGYDRHTAAVTIEGKEIQVTAYRNENYDIEQMDGEP